ncbi:CpsB/CapC family capsule biosynthesis tyrosine phosphatase [Mucilaginibacter sp.]|uniref:tyrosine-protein phosphatase n=1 Tax=Mucilaginibacter sp. TaxID=1882438 RepID=UPI0026071B59|nr:CpsB/CapC family capsule biosynthesis tyrosine phosphatase [Mucilaginibacter sp.]MDB4927381.1 polysaccharide biosynthesis protein phosphatase [Mucilaginibacter sp.]
MFNFLKKKEAGKDVSFNYESVVVDMHSHVLPGIDDGAQNPEESIFLIKKMMELGIKKIIATPHIMVDFYRNTPETINEALEILKAELKKQEIDIEIEAAAEHYFDETFEKRVEDKRLMTMGDNYALFEYSFISPPPNAFSVIQKMIEWGDYKPILAHPERYTYMDTEAMAVLRSWGCNMQMNTISLTGYYGKDVKKKAEDMVNMQLVDFISSDMHHPRHAQAFKDALAMPLLKKILFDYPLKNIMLK